MLCLYYSNLKFMAQVYDDYNVTEGSHYDFDAYIKAGEPERLVEFPVEKNATNFPGEVGVGFRGWRNRTDPDSLWLRGWEGPDETWTQIFSGTVSLRENGETPSPTTAH